MFFNISLAFSQTSNSQGTWEIINGSVSGLIDNGYIISKIESFDTRNHVYHMRSEDLDNQQERIICIISLKLSIGSSTCYKEIK